MTISLCGGPPARLWAINAGLRRFRPNYLHLYELKSFWYEKVLNDQDMDFHPFSKIETHPALALEQYDDSMHPYVRQCRVGCGQPSLVLTAVRHVLQLPQLVAEIKLHRESFLQRVHSEEGKEIAMFWLRKTQKPVRCAVHAQSAGHVPGCHGGMVVSVRVCLCAGSVCTDASKTSETTPCIPARNQHGGVFACVVCDRVFVLTSARAYDTEGVHANWLLVLGTERDWYRVCQ